MRSGGQGATGRFQWRQRVGPVWDSTTPTASSNKLWAILSEHWPGAAKVFHKLTSQVALAFLADYPTPQSAALLGEGRMRQFCHRHSYRGGKSAAALVRRLRAAPADANPLAPKVLEAIIRGSIAQIDLLNTEIARLEYELADALLPIPKLCCSSLFHALLMSASQRSSRRSGRCSSDVTIPSPASDRHRHLDWVRAHETNETPTGTQGDSRSLSVRPQTRPGRIGVLSRNSKLSSQTDFCLQNVWAVPSPALGSSPSILEQIWRST